MERFELQLEGNSRRDLTSTIEGAAKTLGLLTTQVTTLSEYPGSVHWHFKKGKVRGTLEMTWWERKNRLWFKVAVGRTGAWVEETAARLRKQIERALQ